MCPDFCRPQDVPQFLIAFATNLCLLCRVTSFDIVLEPEEEILPPTAEQAKQYAQQYQQLKREMLGRTQRFGGFLAAYLFLTVSGQAGSLSGCARNAVNPACTLHKHCCCVPL